MGKIKGGKASNLKDENLLKKSIKQDGITLIALVITIIVLIILAGITIAALTGENGILKNATKAKEETEQAQQDELNKLWELNNIIDGNTKGRTAVYIWSLSDVNFNYLKAEVDYLNINTIYLSTGRELAGSSTFARMMAFCSNNNIDLYLLDGDVDWTESGEEQNIKEVIDKVDRYNNSGVDTKVKGVNLDVEFYLTDAYRNATTTEEKIRIFNQYSETMLEQAEYAKTKNLEYVICLPVWLDNIDKTILEKLYSADNITIELMNYEKNGQIDNIKTEIELARKYNKNITTIAELGNSSETEQTFYNDGIDICIEKQNEILEYYDYSKLGKAYHHYTPIVELLEKVIDLDNLYELDLYSYYGGTSVEVQNVYAVCGEGKIKGILEKSSSSNEYIYKFYGMNYGQDYKIVVEDNTYTANQTINKQKPDDEERKEHDTLRLEKISSYTLEIYGYLDDETPISLEGGRMKSGDEVIEGKVTEANGVKILIFTGLMYDKEYTLEVDNQGYDIQENTYKYTNDNTDNYYGNHVTLIKK